MDFFYSIEDTNAPILQYAKCNVPLKLQEKKNCDPFRITRTFVMINYEMWSDVSPSEMIHKHSLAN